MIDPVPAERRSLPVSPQLALRVAIMGGLALVLFAIIFFRLWYLQVLSGDQYRAEAETNQLRILPIAAPRGEILDRNGAVIAGDRTTNAVQIVPAELPPAGHLRKELYARLGHVLGMKAADIESLVIRGREAEPYADVTIKVDTGFPVLAFLAEHEQQFPGVTQGQIEIRDYPYHDLASQVLGYVSQINTDELTYKQFKGVQQGTIVGQYGIEAAYDPFLRGHLGQQRIEVNSEGQYQGSEPSVKPVAGDDVRLTLDLGLEQEGDRALLAGIGLANADGNPADAGAFVALDPRNGDVLAMGSYPSFDPNVFAKPLTEPQYKALIGDSNQAPGPLFNRAIDGTYPTGSTFKPITALAGLKAGVISPYTQQGGGACVVIALERFCNAGTTNYGDLDLENAIKVSEDTYFYEVGAALNGLPHEPLQAMARELGLGNPTGIDLPDEASGIVPDRRWRQEQIDKCERLVHHPACVYSDGDPWTIGDNVQLATGQGDLLATPLQMATVYSSLANTYMNGNGHGEVPVPHLAEAVDNSTGGLIQLIQPPPARHIYLNPNNLAVVMAGLHDATSQPGGTSADVWAGFPRAVFGKTGTAQHANQADQAWYVCYLPDAKRPIVIAVTIEKGGFGDQSAAPVARLIASEWFHQPEKLVSGSSPDL